MEQKLGLNDYCELAYQNAKDKGFHDDEDIRDDTYFLPTRLMLMVSEISELLEEHRNSKKPTEIYYNPEKPDKPEGIPCELADLFIRGFDFAKQYGIDLEEVVQLKMKYNATRPHKHGGKKV